MSELNLYRINNFYSPKRKARNIRRCSGLRIFTERVYTKNTPRSPCGERGAKTKLVFTAARSLQKQVLCSRRSKVSASRPYAPDTRGVCFQGPSRALWYFKHPAPCGSMPQESVGMKSEFRLQKRKRCTFFCLEFQLSPATVSHCCVAQ